MRRLAFLLHLSPLLANFSCSLFSFLSFFPSFLFSNHPTSPSSQRFHNRRAFVLPFFSLSVRPTGYRCSALLPRYSASYFLSSRPTFGLIAIPTTPPPLLSPLPNQRPCCCVPLINSHNPFLTKKHYEFKEAKVGGASVSRYDSVFPFIDACIVRANFVKNSKVFLSL